MLSFTNNFHKSKNNLHQLDFEPIIISNKNMKQAFPQSPQKKIVKAISNNKIKNQYRQPKSIKNPSREQQYRKQQIQNRNNWNDGGKIQIFDRKLRKNELAAQERRLRADEKKQKTDLVYGIVRNEKQIRNKRMNIQKQKQAQILELKRLIQKQRQQKQKNDIQYELKLKQIQKQRAQLLKLQKKIQQKGVKNKKQYKQQIKVLQSQIPTNDRAKCKQQIKDIKHYQNKQYPQDNRLQMRQKQLQLLTQQRQKLIKNTNTLTYNPTIIPLISRASYKIISTHISTLVELFIDDLLEQQVYLLEQIQLKQKLQKQKNKEQQILEDYKQLVFQFVEESQKIQDRAGRYHTLQFQDIYKPKHYYQEPKSYTPIIQKKYIISGLDDDLKQEIEARKERFIKMTNNFDQYKKNYLTMFGTVTQEIIDQAIKKLALQLDKGSNQFIEAIFRKQFQ